MGAYSLGLTVRHGTLLLRTVSRYTLSTVFSLNLDAVPYLRSLASSKRTRPRRPQLSLLGYSTPYLHYRKRPGALHLSARVVISNPTPKMPARFHYPKAYPNECIVCHNPLPGKKRCTEAPICAPCKFTRKDAAHLDGWSDLKGLGAVLTGGVCEYRLFKSMGEGAGI